MYTTILTTGDNAKLPKFAQICKPSKFIVNKFRTVGNDTLITVQKQFQALLNFFVETSNPKHMRTILLNSDFGIKRDLFQENVT